MFKALSTISLALGLAVSVAPVFAQTTQVSRTTEEIQQPAQVIDSWMQPTYTRKTQVVDQNGDAQVREEPIIQERHEKVMVPTEKTESVTMVKQEPVVSQTTSVIKQRSYRADRQIAHVRRHPAHRYTASTAKRSLAYKTTATRATQTVVEQKQQTTQNTAVFERRDPALDLY
jgi:hypothetical protein